METKEESFPSPSTREDRVATLLASGWERVPADGTPLRPGTFRTVERWGGWYIKLCGKPKNQSKRDAVRKVWASRDEEQRRQIGERISKSRKGQKRSSLARAKTSITLAKNYEKTTKEQRLARTEKMRMASQSPRAKAKRAESVAEWRRKNPGLPGSSGLTIEQKVKLFFASHPEASDAECAKAIGRSVYLVTRFRDHSAKKPYKRDLLAALSRKVPHAEIIRHILGLLPKCPKCGEKAARVHLDVARFGGRWVGHCTCGRSFVLPSGARVDLPRIKRGVDRKSLMLFLDVLAANGTLLRASRVSGISSSTADIVATIILTEIGNYKPGDWRGCNRTRQERLAKCSG